MDNLVVVTGSNSYFFLAACLLEHSLRRAGYTGRFFVLDFGLEEQERAFLQRKNIFRGRPASIPEFLHPFAMKTKIVEYLSDLPSGSTVVWIDADVVVSEGFVPRLTGLLAQMEQERSSLAAAPEAKIKNLFAVYPDLDFAPFRDLIERHAVLPDADYFNVGFIVFRSPEPIRRWKSLADDVPPHALYDQNIFNIVAHTTGNMTILPRVLWNFHGEDFDDLAPLRRGPGETPAVVHFTSQKAGHIDAYQCCFRSWSSRLYEVRLLVDQKYRQAQFNLLMDFLRRNAGALKESKLVRADEADPETFLVWNTPRNGPCPCASGEKYKYCHGKLA